MNVTLSHSRLLMILAFVFFLLATLAVGGVITISAPWLVPAGLTAMTLAFLVP